jgi:hypothetical protein
MFTICTIHYLILRKLYRKRYKNYKLSLDALAFACIFLLFFFFWSLIIDPSTLSTHPGNRNPIKSRPDLIIMIFALIIGSVLIDKSVKNKTNKIRRAIHLTRNVSRIISILYLSIFIVIFVTSFLILIGIIP